jgi:hypothetical protein
MLGDQVSTLANLLHLVGLAPHFRSFLIVVFRTPCMQESTYVGVKPETAIAHLVTSMLVYRTGKGWMQQSTDKV